MKKYQASIIQEKKELDRRIKKLAKLIKSDVFEKLNTVDRALIFDQDSAMEDYSIALECRIERFKS